MYTMFPPNNPGWSWKALFYQRSRCPYAFTAHIFINLFTTLSRFQAHIIIFSIS